jgi:cell division protein ZapA (FtsZ GTPase activity inhibitor)
MSKNRVKLNICGAECVVASDDNEDYVRSIGNEVEKAITAITEKNDRVSLTMAALITALSYCDDAHQASSGADNLRSQIKDYLEDSSRARMEADEARREIERMKREIQTLRARLSDKDAPEIPHGEESSQKAEAAQSRPIAPNAPVQRPQSAQNLQTGSYTRPQNSDKTEPEAEGFISFFEKKDTE